MMQKVRAKVFASLIPNTLEIHIGFGYGLNDGGSLQRVNYRIVPKHLRMPNTIFWVYYEQGIILKVKEMTKEELTIHQN